MNDKELLKICNRIRSISSQEWNIIEFLTTSTYIGSLSSLARYLDKDVSNTHRTVKNLVKKGWVVMIDKGHNRTGKLYEISLLDTFYDDMFLPDKE